MATFDTLYKYTRTPRKGPFAGRKISTWAKYSTKSLTSVHRHIHAKHPEARTFFAADRILTCLIDHPDYQLDEPIVSGGFVVSL